MESIERVCHYEKILDDALEAVGNLSEALDAYMKIRGQLEDLKQYYFVKEWMEDRCAEEEGRFPQDMKRGVLSEDAVFDLVTDEYELLERLKELIPVDKT